MEYTVINNRLFNEDLTHTEFRILTCLIRNYNPEVGYSSITRKQLAANCNMNNNTVGRVLNRLEFRGYIRRGKIKKNRCMSNIYYLKEYLV